MVNIHWFRDHRPCTSILVGPLVYHSNSFLAETLLPMVKCKNQFHGKTKNQSALTRKRAPIQRPPCCLFFRVCLLTVVYIHYRAIHKTKKALNVIMIILEASLANRRPLQQIRWYGTCSLKFNQCTRIQIFHFWAQTANSYAQQTNHNAFSAIRNANLAKIVMLSSMSRFLKNIISSISIILLHITNEYLILCVPPQKYQFCSFMYTYIEMDR